MPEMESRVKADPTLLREPLQKIVTKSEKNYTKKDPTRKQPDQSIFPNVQNSIDVGDSKEQDISDLDLFEKVGSKFGKYLAQYFETQPDIPDFNDFFKWRGLHPVQMLHFESCTDDNGNHHITFQVGLPEIRRREIQKNGLSVIMSYYRAMKDRQEYCRLKAEEEKRRNDASTTIASYFKAMISRLEFNIERDIYRKQRDEAATTIMSYWKAMKSRQSFNKDREEYRQQRNDAALTIMSYWKAMKSRQEFCKDLEIERARRNDAATTIASYFKAMIARREFNEERDAYRQERAHASTVIQSYWRAFEIRRIYQASLAAEKRRKNEAATTIASFYKAMVARKEVCKQLQERRVRGNSAATVIKSYYKAMVARRKMQKYLGIVADRRKRKAEEKRRKKEEERRLAEEKRLEDERLAKIISIKVDLGKNKPDLVVPMRVGGTLEQLRQYMMETYGLMEDDLEKVKVDSHRVSWNTKLDELNIEEIGNAFKVNLKLPDANGRQKVFMHLDKNNQRVLHKDTFYRSITKMGIEMSPRDFKRMWSIMDTDKKNIITYRQFQNVIAPEANMREFAAMMDVLADIPDDERQAYKKADTSVKRRYVFAQSQVVSDNARLHRLLNARDIYSLFGTLDAYMEGRLTLNLFQRLLDIAGLEVNQVHLHYLQAKLCQSRSGRSYLTVEDFLYLMNGEEYVTMQDVLERINDQLCVTYKISRHSTFSKLLFLFLEGITEEEYLVNWKRIYQSKNHQKKMEATYKESRMSPREVLGLPPLPESDLDE